MAIFKHCKNGFLADLKTNVNTQLSERDLRTNNDGSKNVTYLAMKRISLFSSCHELEMTCFSVVWRT